MRVVRPTPLLATLALAASVAGPTAGLASGLAATAGDAGPPVTLLHLSVVGTAHDTPDLLTASLDGTASSADPAAAQRQLDRTMKAATDLAAGNTGVNWQVAGYAVEQIGPASGAGRPTWSAHQTLLLRCTDAATLLNLVGGLQTAGLTVQSLQWELSPARRLAAEQRAATNALTLLRERANAAAAALGLRVGAIRSVSLGEAGGSRPVPLMRMMTAMPVAPQASRTDADISQAADAEIALIP